MFRRVPVKWLIGKLLYCLCRTESCLAKSSKECMEDIEFFIIFSVTAFYLVVMPGRKRFDLFMQDAELSQSFFKDCRRLFLAVAHFVCKLETVVCLDTLNGIWKLFYCMFQELGGRIGALLLECFQVTEPAVFINERMIIFFSSCLSNQAYTGNIFHINLDFLPQIRHLFIRFWQFDGFPVNPAQELIQGGDRSGVHTLPQLAPEHHQTSVRVSAAHIPDQSDLCLRMLIGMAVGAV